MSTSDPLTGFSSTTYLASLPQELQQSPNVQRVIALDLFQAIKATPNWVETAPVQLSSSHLEAIQQAVLTDIANLTNAYHNRLHTEQVMTCCQRMATAAQLSALETQALLLGGLFHDFDHPGVTLRQTVLSATRNDMSNEEFAALKADEIVGSDLSLSQRLQLQGLILATSFGQKKAEPVDELPRVQLQRDYEPYTPLEKLLAFADIGRFMLSVEAHVQGSLATLQESGAQPASYDQWRQGELGFLGYIAHHLDGISPQISTESFASLQTKLSEVRQYFEAAATGVNRDDLESRYLQVLQRN